MSIPQVEPEVVIERREKIDERSSLTYGEAARTHAISKRAMERLVANGEIKVVRFGRSVRIPVTELEQYVRRQMQQA